MKKFVVILGVGYKSSTNDVVINENVFLSRDVKINIGAACAHQLAAKGHDLIIISRSQRKLDIIKKGLNELFPDRTINAVALDVLDSKQVNSFFEMLDPSYEYAYIHSAGLGAGGYQIKDNNPYLAIEDIPIDLPTMEFEVVVKSLLSLVRGFLPFFKRQAKAKVIVVNSMSGIRPYPLGFSHSSAKAGLHNAVRSLTLELNKENIFFSEVNPGMVDTGHYDDKSVIDSINMISKEFGYSYEKLPQMSPYEVGDAVRMCLESTAHILTVDMVSEGQIPHIGA